MAEPQIPFLPEAWVIDRNNPSKPGQFTGAVRTAGPHVMVQLRYPNGEMQFRPLASLEPMASEQTGDRSPRALLASKHFGNVRDLRRLVTYEKLRGTLNEIIYSMEAAQIDFYPYQFKPVLKFINSPTERLIIADEVGLGKTIESALIWMEMQARRQAKRLLVVCPKILAEKWRAELRNKFLLDARIVDFRDLQQEIGELKTNGPGHQFVAIAPYTGLTPARAELHLLDDPPDHDQDGSPKTRFLRELRHWGLPHNPFDLVVFDEAHYMRNPATAVFHLGESLAANAGAVLCVSATPVHNSNDDLRSLLRLVDESFFETQGVFEELLEANRPAVQAGNALARTPIDQQTLIRAVDNMGRSRFIGNAPLYHQLRQLVESLDPNDKSSVARAQDIVEKLNLLGAYINRTRRVQVTENRPLRDPVTLKVTYSDEEMRLYNAVLAIVRRNCKRDNRPFHVFQVLGLQLRAASCLPVLADEIRRGRFGDIEEAQELLVDAFGGESVEQVFSEDKPSEEAYDLTGLAKLLDHDFKANDTKYEKLRDMLRNQIKDEKVVIFAFFRGTISYLRNRLLDDEIDVTVIHGGVDDEQRWKELERFRDPNGPRVLVSSEVGSEGIDLQFCRVLVNYDLPWNPMRVEQRIGRIDRVGQQARHLSIVNFKIKDTVEERLFDRLHSKLDRFANSLGDLESVIGREVQNLTVELLSKDLTPEQEAMLMEQAEHVIEQRLLQIQALEESGDALLALSDYVQRRISEDRDMGRYMQPGEIEDYVLDFFQREFQGTVVNQNTPASDCYRFRLSYAAQNSLSDFIKDDRSLSARPLRQREFTLSFRKEALQTLSVTQRRGIHFANHLSPLIRWITKVNHDRAASFYKVSAAQLFESSLPPGDYCYRIERWQMRGLSNRESLAYGICRLGSHELLPPDQAETVLQQVLRAGTDWDYVDANRDVLLQAHDTLAKALENRFSQAVIDFEAENKTTHQIKVQRVQNIFERRIAQDEQRLRTLHAAQRNPRVIRLTEGRLNAARENKENRLRELDEKSATDYSTQDVAAGVFRCLGDCSESPNDEN
jgi:SNF2 family DNA or RNA helicase